MKIGSGNQLVRKFNAFWAINSRTAGLFGLFKLNRISEWRLELEVTARSKSSNIESPDSSNVKPILALASFA